MVAGKWVLMVLLPWTLPAGSWETDVINVSGEASIEVDPDYATVMIGARTTNKDITRARLEVRKASDSFLELCEERNISDDRIATEKYQTEKSYEQIDGEREFAGYEVTLMYSVRFDDFERMNDVLAVCNQEGICGIFHVRFDVENRDSLERVASVEAIRNAYQNAKSLAQEGNRTLGKMIRAANGEIKGWHYRPRIRHQKQGDVFGKGGAGGRQTFVEIKPPRIKIRSTVYAGYTLK